LAVIIEDNS